MDDSNGSVNEIRHQIESTYRDESRRVLATLIRLLGDFDLAEEALQEAFASAMVQWPREGIPANPRTWLVSVGRFKAIDAVRRRARLDASLGELAARAERLNAASTIDSDSVEDDQMRLIFTCCHPALAPNTQIALTLREVCGLTTEAIASAFLASPSTVAQRIVRGKAKIRDAAIPYQVPTHAELPARLESVLAVVYLVFNEGYRASSGDSLTRPDLSQEAIRLGRLLAQLLPDTEVLGLLALMLLHESRRMARTTAEGDLVRLEDQDRALWDHAMIAEGRALVDQALHEGPVGSYTLQAAIALVHATASRPDATDWSQIIDWYDLLMRASGSAIVELNRAVAIAMRDGAASGLALIDAIHARGELLDYQLAHAARADLCRRLGRLQEARAAYLRAIELTQQEPERRFLQARLVEISSDP